MWCACVRMPLAASRILPSSWHRLNQRLIYANTSQLSKPRLTLYTKEDCSLCDEALEVLLPYMDRVCFESVDITLPENKHWYRHYRYDIPVFHLDGEYLMKHRADTHLFLQRLQERECKLRHVYESNEAGKAGNPTR